MLVLSREPSQDTDARFNELIIDGDIRVYVLEVQGDRVQIGIDADRSIPVVRGELPPRMEEGQR